MTKKTLLVLTLLAAAIVSGCAAVAVGGVGAVALAANDRRTTGIYIEDQNIELKAAAQILQKHKDAHVNTTSFNRRVLLTGEAPTEAEKKAIEATVTAIAGVTNVTNELVVGGNSSLTSRGNDSLITSTIKARSVGNAHFNPNHVKVVTEAGVVFLMGMVTQEEGEAAAEVARSTSGVSRVVKVFEYISKS